MISAAFAGIIAGSVTSLTPMGYAPDSASAGLLISLAASISAAAGAAGASPADRILNALFALWLTAILSFGTMWVLGSFRVAKLARFVPFSVVAGFLGATGILLIVAGLSLALGHPFDGKILASDLNDANIGKVLASVILATLLMALRAGWKDWRIILADALLIAAFGFVILHLQRAG